MRKQLKIIAIVCMFFGGMNTSSGQDLIIESLNNMPNFINPAFYGFKNSTKIGVIVFVDFKSQFIQCWMLILDRD